MHQQQQLGYQSGFEEPDIEKRTTPSLLLPEARSIIAIALAYPSKLKNAPRSTKKSVGEFLSSILGTRLSRHFARSAAKLEQFILERVPDAKVKSMVDTGELADRAVAERAGIGWSGKIARLLRMNLVRMFI